MKHVFGYAVCGRSLVICMVALTCVGFARAQSYQESVVADNPLVYWEFNNSLADTMGNLNLDPAAAPAFVDGPGETNTAYSSSEGQAWAAAFGTVDLNGLFDFSYEMWIDLAGDNEGKYILQRIGLVPEGETGAGENSLLYGDGNIEFIGRGGELFEPAVIPVADETEGWHHLVLTYNYADAMLILYWDGAEAYRQDGALLEPIYGGNSDELYIGATRQEPESRVFNGFLDEIALYDITLSDTQVAAHWNAALPGGYADAVTADAPLVYWRFEGNFEDEMDRYDLMPSGVTFVSGPGSAGNSALFGRVTSNESQILYDGIDAFTYEFWFNPINLSSSSYILFRRPGSTQHAAIYAYNPDALEFFFAQAGGANVRPLATVPNETDNWYYCAIVNDPDAAEMRIYIDGELATQEAATATPGAGTLVVVGGSDKGDNFNGYIDEVAMYNYALSVEQLQAHYQAPFADPSPIREWAIY